MEQHETKIRKLESLKGKIEAKSSQLEVVVNELNTRIEELSTENKRLLEFGGRRHDESKPKNAESKEMDVADEEKYVALTEALRYMRRKVAFWRNKHAEQELRKSLPPLSFYKKNQQKKTKLPAAMRRRVNDLELELSKLQTSARVISLNDKKSESEMRSRVLRSDQLKLEMSKLREELNREEIKLCPSVAAVNTFTGTSFRAKTLLRDVESKEETAATCLGRVRIPMMGSTKLNLVSVCVSKSFVRELHETLI